MATGDLSYTNPCVTLWQTAHLHGNANADQIRGSNIGVTSNYEQLCSLVPMNVRITWVGCMWDALSCLLASYGHRLTSGACVCHGRGFPINEFSIPLNSYKLRRGIVIASGVIVGNNWCTRDWPSDSSSYIIVRYIWTIIIESSRNISDWLKHVFYIFYQDAKTLQKRSNGC